MVGGTGVFIGVEVLVRRKRALIGVGVGVAAIDVQRVRENRPFSVSMGMNIGCVGD
jgi:hypothetical protein